MSHSFTMTPERWQRLQSLFDQALALEAPARADFIVSACGDDTSLREQLLSLVMASASDDQFEAHVDKAISATLLRDTELQPGHIVGRYRIVRLIGRGGMGAVYLAQRADQQFEQRVAIKVVADGAMSSRIVARLRSERQILANLNHPNIARLFDGGATSDGTPYLAMEYVDGQRIDRYCEAQRLTIPQRLALFQKVCAAVQYAHQSLVVHRDIKPSNILVTARDGANASDAGAISSGRADGVPKLLDFGIAKLVDPNATTQNLALTRLHERVLTPSNASPEQVRGEPVGTTSDVYALGVLLYELLTGLPPYNVNGLSFEQIEKLICEQVPVKPSAAVLAASKLALPTADAALSKPLQGDLDTIVLKALQKDPSRRYSSAAALADDVANYLSNRPITARPDSFRYRVGKFWRRNRWALSSAAAVTLIVAALTVFYTWRLAVERDNAAVEAAKAKQVAEFLTEMFRTADPAAAQGRQISALDILDRGAERIDAQLNDQPRVRADLSSVIGVSYKSLGAYDRAQSLLETALNLQRAAGLENTREYVQVLYELANVKRFRGDFVGAVSLFTEVLGLQRELGDSAHADLAATLTNFGMTYYEKAKYQEARRLQEEAFALIKARGVENDASGAEVMNGFALVLQQLNEYDRAEVLLRQSLEIRSRLLGDRHPMTITSKSNLSLLLRTTGRYRESVQLMEELLPLRRAVLGADHPNVGFLLHQLGGTLTLMGDCDGADRYLQEARTIIQARLGVEHARYSAVIRYIGMNEMARGNYRAAEQSLRQARGIEVKNFGFDDSQPYRTDVMIARALRGQNSDRQANQLLETTYAYFLAHSKAEKGRLLLEMGRMRLAQNRWPEAQEFFARDLKEFEAIGGADDPANIGPLQGLAQVAMQAADFATAVKHGQRALDIALKKIPDARADIAVAKSVYGAALNRAGKSELAAPLLREGYETLASVRPANDPVVRTAKERFAALAQRVEPMPAVRASTTP